MCVRACYLPPSSASTAARVSHVCIRESYWNEGGWLQYKSTSNSVDCILTHLSISCASVSLKPTYSRALRTSTWAGTITVADLYRSREECIAFASSRARHVVTHVPHWHCSYQFSWKSAKRFASWSGETNPHIRELADVTELTFFRLREEGRLRTEFVPHSKHTQYSLQRPAVWLILFCVKCTEDCSAVC